jgi:hypothetical protein
MNSGGKLLLEHSNRFPDNMAVEHEKRLCGRDADKG